MKTMILKKPLPGAKAGSEVRVDDIGDGRSQVSEKNEGYEHDVYAYIPNSELDEWVGEKGPWEPEENHSAYFITHSGEVRSLSWGDEMTRLMRNFLGVYRSEQDAIEVRDKVREFVRSLNK